MLQRTNKSRELIVFMGRKKYKYRKRRGPFRLLADLIEDLFEFLFGAFIIIVSILVLWSSDASIDSFVNRVSNSFGAVETTSDTSPQVDSSSSSIEMEEVIVTRVIDGDTIECSNGETVRLIGVDTPESTNEKERYGKQASEYTEDQLEGETVWLTKDKSNTDQYGRSLRFVWTEPPTSFTEEEFREKCFNAELVLNGYATESTYSPDDTYSHYFKKFEDEAREAGVGMWE